MFAFFFFCVVGDEMWVVYGWLATFIQVKIDCLVG